MSYALASYTLVVAGLLAYGAWLARTRRQLERELEGLPKRNDG